MKLLYVHERFVALAVVEANAFITAEQFGQRGHDIAILHGPITGKMRMAGSRSPTRPLDRLLSGTCELDEKRIVVAVGWGAAAE